jgi:hypothetical protein
MTCASDAFARYTLRVIEEGCHAASIGLREIFGKKVNSGIPPIRSLRCRRLSISYWGVESHPLAIGPGIDRRIIWPQPTFMDASNQG